MKVTINPAAPVDAVLVDGVSHVRGDIFEMPKKTVEAFTRNGVPVLIPAKDLPDMGTEVQALEADEADDGTTSQEDN